MQLINKKQTITVVNKVKMADYLASVIGSEIDPKWPEAALRAQAVVARTYALRNLNSYLSQGYHLSNTIYSQVYKGHRVTTPKVYQAVKDTAGQVLTYRGELISAVYHSNAGGKTAQGAVIWGGETPYLQSVDSKDYDAPNYQWQKKYSREELKKILSSKGIKISKIDRIGLQGLGPSGRAEKVVINDGQQEVSVDSSKFRFWLNLRSTKFSMERYEQGYVFIGKGWGHGVGMSQWGAYQMAKEGSTYQEILHHYYQNTKLVKKDVGGIDNEG
nr:SpoIID/LytB domain-containing protein [Halanaerobacter jeridensis]